MCISYVEFARNIDEPHWGKLTSKHRSIRTKCVKFEVKILLRQTKSNEFTKI